MDTIIKNCMEAFLDDNNIHAKEESVKFEHFANFCIFSRYCPSIYLDNHLFYEACHTGQGGDLGIDGIMVIVNNHPVLDEEEFVELVGNANFKVKIIIVQAKTSSTFDSGEMMKTGLGVLNLLSGKSLTLPNKKVAAYIRLIQKIYSKSNKFECEPAILC